MKQFLILVLSCVFFSCGEDSIDGRGTNPELNIEQYTFGREGGSIEVYSTIGCSLSIYLDGNVAEENITRFKNTGGIKSIDGGWYVISTDISGEKIRIETKPNDSNREKTFSFSIMSGNYGIQMKYTQEP